VRGSAILIRPEAPNDTVAIHDLTKRAFDGKRYSDGNEQDLIDALRHAGALSVSLVAEDAKEIVGHVAFSPAIAQDGSAGWYALGPISVEPTRQRQGIGGALVHQGMVRLIAMEASGCVLIGDTNYYQRHGFAPRPDLAPAGEPAANYMIRSLIAGTPTPSVSFHPILQEGGGMP
jgi:putative acetyltransferase